jgi:hypothetical protein
VWQVNLTSLGRGDLSHLRFASGGLEADEEAAWVLLQTRNTLTPEWADMDFAMWHTLNPDVPITSPAAAWLNLAQRQEQLDFPVTDFSEVMIATPVDIDAPATCDQEFPFLIPEPASLILFVTGATGTAKTVRRQSHH